MYSGVTLAIVKIDRRRKPLKYKKLKKVQNNKKNPLHHQNKPSWALNASIYHLSKRTR